jgi:hypothetical protein
VGSPSATTAETGVETGASGATPPPQAVSAIEATIKMLKRMGKFFFIFFLL